MEEELNIRKVYNDELRKWQGKPLTSNQESLDSYQEICCGCVLLSEENLREMHRYWEITELAPMRRMIDCVFDHPRLRLQLLRLRLVVIQRIGNLHGHELSAEEDVVAEIARYEHNIALADAYRFDEVENRKRSGLRYDPIEWSRAYEDAIDDVEREIDVVLASQPRGMGFCFAHWHHREQALSARGIAWKNPHIMNPRVMFD